MKVRDRRSMSRARRATRLDARSLAILFAALIAFTWQSFLTQTHVHDPVPISSGTTIAGAEARVSATQAPSDLPANCPICREIAHAGLYVTPAPVVLSQPAMPAFWLAATEPRRLTLRHRSPDWRSRAPPAQLQA